MWYIFSTVINAIYCRKPAFIIVDSKAGFFMLFKFSLEAFLKDIL